MRTRTFPLAFACAWPALVLGACSPSIDTVRPRAASDMACPRDRLSLRAIDDATVVARGCGQQNTYIYSETSETWVLNNARRVEGSPEK